MVLWVPILVRVHDILSCLFMRTYYTRVKGTGSLHLNEMIAADMAMKSSHTYHKKISSVQV